MFGGGGPDKDFHHPNKTEIEKPAHATSSLKLLGNAAYFVKHFKKRAIEIKLENVDGLLSYTITPYNINF